MNQAKCHNSSKTNIYQAKISLKVGKYETVMMNLLAMIFSSLCRANYFYSAYGFSPEYIFFFRIYL